MRLREACDRVLNLVLASEKPRLRELVDPYVAVIRAYHEDERGRASNAVPTLNQAIIDRWSEHALETVKAAAWKKIDEELEGRP